MDSRHSKTCALGNAGRRLLNYINEVDKVTYVKRGGNDEILIRLMIDHGATLTRWPANRATAVAGFRRY